MVFIAIAVLCLISLSIIIYMFKEAFANRVLYHSLTFKEFPASIGEMRMFFITDIHRRKISDQIIFEVKGKVDLVIIGGDLAEKGVSFQKIRENLLKLRSLGPVYFVWGNNDYELDPYLFEQLLMECEVKVLRNSALLFKETDLERIFFIGVDDSTTERDCLEEAISNVNNTGVRLLISHNPNILDKVLPEHQISLVLSGHTHGGQIRILGYSPYDKGGLKNVGKTTVFISNGYGTTALPLRLGARAETHIITLKHAN